MTWSYEKQLGYTGRKNRDYSASVRDIGEIPKPANPRRRKAAVRDFRKFCESYFRQTFRLEWCDDHLKIIGKIESAVLKGGLFALAMPRGSGKTTLCECACIWAVLYGHHSFVCLIGSDTGSARSMLDSIKVECETNERLAEDFPEAVYPILKLERIHNRASGQTYRGRPTRIMWTADEIRFPTIPKSSASGSIIRVSGIEARIRGMKAKLPSGKSVRPSLVVLDDPQTDESARSVEQVHTRLKTLNGAILNLAGPGQKISGIMPCTVIEPDDMADQILDRTKHPVWQGERCKLVYQFPTEMSLWDEYATLRADSFVNDGDGSEATEFYRENRDAMDAGCQVAWAERHNEDEISAIQNAMNLLYRDKRAFFAEYQNDPMPTNAEAESELKAADILKKLNGIGRGVVPLGCTALTAFIDVQAKLLYWCVCGWSDGFTGYVLAYGTEPEQKAHRFTLRDARHTLDRAYPGKGLEAGIYAGLESLTARILASEWPVEDGRRVRVDRCLIDANWGQTTDLIYQFCRASVHAAILIPSHGKYIGAASTPMREYRRKPGDRIGPGWRVSSGVASGRAIKHVVYDTNHWKSHVAARLVQGIGSTGCLSLFGRDPGVHDLFADHLASEYRVKTSGRGREVDEWKLRANGLDNHWLDCLVGCAVGASIAGVTMSGDQGAARTRKRYTQDDFRLK